MVAVGGHEETRSQLIDAAVERWRKDLIDVGGRNTLLYYKDLKVGTLDLHDAQPAALSRLLAGRQVAMSTLYTDEAGRADARKRLRTIHRKIRELQEERGINTGYLTTGMATWTEPETGRGTKKPAAPVILRQIDIKPRSASEDDFDLTVSDEPEINPVLVHVLAEQYSVSIRADDLIDLITLNGHFDPQPALDRFTKLASDVAGFAIATRTVLGTFTYAKLPMVNDLQDSHDLLMTHDVVAALAGDPSAQSAIGDAGGTDAIHESMPDHTPPQDEFLVADADASQNYAINAVVAGSNLVIKGPPGTGKSQTITNLIATLIARGNRVLFVAEKRAAIDAVLSRLRRVDLGDWVMDLHDGVSSRRKVAQDLAATLGRAGRTPPTNLTELHRNVTTNRERLLAHDRAMHTARLPWGISAFEAQASLSGLNQQGVEFRMTGAALHNATKVAVAAARADLLEYTDLGGLADDSASPWTGAPIATAEQAQLALAMVNRLRGHTVPVVSQALNTVIRDTGLPEPQRVADWQRVFSLLDSVANLQKHFTPAIFEQDLPKLIAATANRTWRKQHQITLSWTERRRLKKHTRTMCHLTKQPIAKLHTQLVAADALNTEWRRIRIDDRSPRLPANLDGAHNAYDQLSSELRALAAHMHTTSHLEALNTNSALPQRLDDLLADRATLVRLPRRNTLEQRLHATGLGPLLAELRTRRISANQAGEALEAIWLQSILDEVALTDPAYGSFQGMTLNRTVEAFQHADTAHIKATPARAQRACAEQLFAALDRHPEQKRLIRAEAGKKTRHRPMRDLITQAPDVLLALKPCWAMSPLVVSQVLPMRQLFDVVIFDEASQIPPADAVPSIARGKRIAVAGDERQLPPTTFFATSVADDADDADPDVLALTSGYESVLDVLAAITPFQSLGWHYRSQDERLIAFSNAHIYDSSLTTFPGSHSEGVLRHVEVLRVPGIVSSEESATAEVEKVIQLIIEHAEQRPKESLGVITMGIKHADRIDAALRSRLAERPDLDDFFSESRDERFFVKNLERVQGDERDAIILSIGYGKAPDGHMRYNFGPVNRDGGERRLNVAVSRSKKRMTAVSSFGSTDLDPNRLNNRGTELLGAYIRFMESGGHDLGSFVPTPPELNPFEIDVRDRLTRAGVPLTAQFGVGNYRIDFAAAHPKHPGHMILAIEADGASYHSSHTARDRDRLRQEHLERLGWHFHRIWSTDWFRDPETEAARAVTAYEAAVRNIDAGTQRHVTRESAKTTTPTFAATQQKQNRPQIYPGYPITEYTKTELVALIRWIQSDGYLRDEDQLICAAMDELGFQKRGSRIVNALQQAIRTTRRRS